MKIKRIEKRSYFLKNDYVLFKVAYEFDSPKEIEEFNADMLLCDSDVLEHDKYSLNVVDGDLIITDSQKNEVVAHGLEKVNKFMKQHNLVSIIDMYNLEVE